MYRKNKLFILSIITLFFLCSVYYPSLSVKSHAVQDDKTAAVDKIFTRWDKEDSPGCALGIIKDGKLIYKRGYGMANLEYNIPITSNSVFRIGSTSKQFTAICILLAADMGKLSLDDDIRKFIPELYKHKPPVTIRHLVHHTSGVRDYLTLQYLANKTGDDFYTNEDVIELLARQKELNFEPGDEFLYSNSGYFLLSVIIERASGKSLNEFAAEHIFKPLGMKNTHYQDDHTMIVKNRASGYSPIKNGFRINMTTLDMVGDGGVFTTVEDLYMWDQNFYNNTLNSQNISEKMLTKGKLNSGRELEYAFGLMATKYKGLNLIRHGGAFVGFRAEMTRFPDQKLSVICLANSGSINPSRLCDQVADIYLADYFKKETTEEGKSGADITKLEKEELEKRAGNYENKEIRKNASIQLIRDKLYLNFMGKRFPLKPESKTKFVTDNTTENISVLFIKNELNSGYKLEITVEGEKTLNLNPVGDITLSPSQMEEYAGTYFSEELRVNYVLKLENSNLYFKHRNAPKPPLKPEFTDIFKAGGLTVEFQRNKQNELCCFKIQAGRVKNIKFEKIK